MYNKIEFVNFNCTFGEKNEPLMNHFSDIFYPALTAGYRFKKKNNTQWRLQNVHIDKLNGNYVIIGNFVKDTIIEIKSHSLEDDIIPADERYPSSPYSIFILSLKNHRMAFYRNQAGSPLVRSMKTIISDCIKRYLRSVNQYRDINNLLPFANINIAPIPSASTIDEKFKSVKKIKRLSFKLFSLNGGDPDISDAFSLLRNYSDEIGTNSTTIQMPAPSNIYTVKESIKQLNGLALAKIKATSTDGTPIEFDMDSFTESIYVTVDNSSSYKDITKSLCSSIEQHPIMNNTNELNNDIYKNSLNDIISILGGDNNEPK